MEQVLNACYLVLDLETTGLSIKKAEPVQIAFGEMLNGKTGLRAYYTIDPDEEITPGAQAIHGFSKEALAFSYKFADIAKALYTLLGEGTVPVLGYNIKRFDLPILTRMFDRCGIHYNPETVDVSVMAKILLPGRESYALANVLADLDIKIAGQPHDAWRDCRAAWALFMRLVAMNPQIGAMTQAELLDWLRRQ